MSKVEWRFNIFSSFFSLASPIPVFNWWGWGGRSLRVRDWMATNKTVETTSSSLFFSGAIVSPLCLPLPFLSIGQCSFLHQILSRLTRSFPSMGRVCSCRNRTASNRIHCKLCALVRKGVLSRFGTPTFEGLGGEELGTSAEKYANPRPPKRYSG